MGRQVRGVAAWWLLALTVAPVTAGEQGKAPQWTEIPPLCGRLQKDGWKPADPLGQEEEGRAEVRVGGGSGIFLCRVKRALSMQGRGTPTELEVFMQHRGGDNVSVSARIWRDADRQAALEAAAELFTRLVRDLGVIPPARFASSPRTCRS